MQFVALNKSLAKIQGNEDVRTYLKAVAQDPQNETINYTNTKQAVWQMNVTDEFTARLTLITNLNNIFFLLQAIREEAKFVETAKVWLWENHTRLLKMIAVSMVLEGYNLRSFGAIPELSDIPQSLVVLHGLILESGKDFEQIAKVHASRMEGYGSAEFYSMYLGHT